MAVSRPNVIATLIRVCEKARDLCLGQGCLRRSADPLLRDVVLPVYPLTNNFPGMRENFNTCEKIATVECTVAGGAVTPGAPSILGRIVQVLRGLFGG
jgi:hypothetical protein